MRISKGYMTLMGFLAAFKRATFTQEDELFVHFRYGTSGGNTPDLTHPFPITQNLKTMRQLSCTVHRALIHNGVLGKGESNASDTMVFIRDVLAPLRTLLQDEGVKQSLSTLVP